MSSPLIRLNFSNEKLQGVLFSLLTLYLLPSFIISPVKVLYFLAIVSFSLFMDTLLNYIRYKKIICSVSASITATVIFILATNLPLYLLFLSCFIALVLGKHIWGGTGFNMFNPAILSLFIISLFFKSPNILNYFNYFILLIIPLAIFIFLRPFNVLAFILGGIIAFLIKGNFTLSQISSSGLLFYSLVVVTDPVTVRKGVITAIISLLSTLLYLVFDNFLISVLTINIYSYIVNKVRFDINHLNYKPLKIKQYLRVVDFPKNHKIENKKNILDGIDLLKKIEVSDIRGHGGGGFKLSKKLNSLLSSTVAEKYMIINGTECDPGLLHDVYVIKNYYKEIEEATKGLLRVCNFKEIILTSKTNINKRSDIIRNLTVPNFYPAGAEKILIKEIFNRDIAVNEYPSNLGFLVVNVQTLLALYKLLNNINYNKKYITLGNLDLREASIIEVQNGQKISSILDSEGIISNRIFSGGGLMASYRCDDNSIINDKTNSIFYGKAARFKESPQCSNCNNCLVHCPAKINVKNSYDRIRKSKVVSGLNRCIKCGSCSYVCLAGRDLCGTFLRYNEK